RVVAVVAGVDHEDVATLDAVARGLLPALEVLGSVEVEIADAHALEVDHACGTDEEIKWQVTDELAAGHEVRRPGEVRADVQRHRDLLAAGAIEGQVLDPPDLRARVARERGRVQREVLREVEELHCGELSFFRSILPIALRGSFSSTTMRRGHLYVARRSRANAISSRSSSGDEPDGTTKAVTSSPQSSLGNPATATSPTDGCVSSTSSTSRGYTLNPPVMISSFSRPRMASVPSFPISPTSP